MINLTTLKCLVLKPTIGIKAKTPKPQNPKTPSFKVNIDLKHIKFVILIYNFSNKYANFDSKIHAE